MYPLARQVYLQFLFALNQVKPKKNLKKPKMKKKKGRIYGIKWKEKKKKARPHEPNVCLIFWQFFCSKLSVRIPGVSGGFYTSIENEITTDIGVVKRDGVQDETEGCIYEEKRPDHVEYICIGNTGEYWPEKFYIHIYILLLYYVVVYDDVKCI